MEFLFHLEYLSLAHNKITRLQGLLSLKSLLYLDVSENQIAELEVPQIPKTIALLKVRENPFCREAGYRERLILELQDLEELDGEEITMITRFEARGVP